MERSHRGFVGSDPSTGLPPGSLSSPVQNGQIQSNFVFRHLQLKKKIKDLQKGVDKVNKKLKDPVEGSKTRDINVDMADVADRKVGELQPSPVGKVHLETKK